MNGQCPVCLARFRGSRLCSRCGADLEPLMVLAVRAWKLREAARNAVRAGDFEQGYELAVAAQGVQRTREADALRLASGWMAGPGGVRTFARPVAASPNR